MDRATFLGRFPEFATAPTTPVDLIVTKLADAELSTSDSWGTRRNDALSLLTAHLLALSPYGVNAQMVRKDGSTTYGDRLQEMREIHGCARSRIR